MPADSVSITDEDYNALFAGQAEGRCIVADAEGRPVLQDPVPPTDSELLSAAKAARLAAYREEADPLFFKAQRGEVDAKAWTDKVAEIRARFPLP